MTLEEIKTAVLAGKTVHWANSLYIVKHYEGEFSIVCTSNGYTTGLTSQSGVMTEKEKDFYIAK